MLKKIVLFLTMLLLFCSALPVSAAETIAEGGAVNYEWYLTSDGVLTIAADYGTIGESSYLGAAKWYPYRESITSVVITGHADTIGYGAFFDLPKLKSISLSSNVRTIGKYAFLSCTSLKSFFFAPFYTPSIGEAAFQSCTALETLSVSPETEIAADAFYGCTALEEIYISGQTHFYTYNPEFSSSSFAYVTATVYYPRGMTVYNQGNYGGSLTWECANFGTCGENARWEYNESSKTLTISGQGEPAHYLSGNTTPWSAFVRTDIQKIVVKKGITHLPSYLFEYANEATEILLPEGLESLACNAFNDCWVLNHLIIPSTVKSFTKDTYFNRCHVLTDLYYPGTKEEWSLVENAAGNLASVHNPNQITVHFLKWNPSTATCGEAGYEGYYSFDGGVYTTIYDKNRNPLAAPIPMAPTGKHHILWKEAIEADCHTKGSQAHWECSDCQKWFADQTGSSEINSVYSDFNPDHHTGGTVIRDTVSATPEANGYTGDTWCLGCNTVIASGAIIYRIKVHGDTTVLPGDAEVLQKVSFSTDKEASYLICHLRYPSKLILKQIFPVDFRYVSYEINSTDDDTTMLTVLCQYADSATLPQNTEITPFQAIFSISPDTLPGEIIIELLDTTQLLGQSDYSFDADFDHTITVLPPTSSQATLDACITDIGAWNQTFTPDIREYTLWVPDSAEEIGLTASFSDGGTLMLNGELMLHNRKKTVYLTENKTIITLHRSGASNATDGVYVLTVLKTPPLIADISEDKKVITVTPNTACTDTTVILALYQENCLSEIYSEISDGSPISITAQKEFDTVKIMHWGNLYGLQPIGQVISLE